MDLVSMASDCSWELSFALGHIILRLVPVSLLNILYYVYS